MPDPYPYTFFCQVHGHVRSRTYESCCRKGRIVTWPDGDQRAAEEYDMATAAEETRPRPDLADRRRRLLDGITADAVDQGEYDDPATVLDSKDCPDGDPHAAHEWNTNAGAYFWCPGVPRPVDHGEYDIATDICTCGTPPNPHPLGECWELPTGPAQPADEALAIDPSALTTSVSILAAARRATIQFVGSTPDAATVAFRWADDGRLCAEYDPERVDEAARTLLDAVARTYPAADPAAPPSGPGDRNDEIRAEIIDVLREKLIGVVSADRLSLVVEVLAAALMLRVINPLTEDAEAPITVERTVPATAPAARQADEIWAAILRAIDETKLGTLGFATAHVAELMADALMDRVVGPLIAERDREHEIASNAIEVNVRSRVEAEEQRQRAEQAGRERDELRRHDAWLAGLLSDENDGRHVVAELDRLAAAVAERDATIAELRSQQTEMTDELRRAIGADQRDTWDTCVGLVRRAVEGRDDLRHRLAGANAQVAHLAGERDRLREADTRVRELHRPWDEHADYCRECSCESPVPMPCPTITALDGARPLGICGQEIATGKPCEKHRTPEEIATLDGTDGGESRG